MYRQERTRSRVMGDEGHLEWCGRVTSVGRATSAAQLRRPLPSLLHLSGVFEGKGLR